MFWLLSVIVLLGNEVNEPPKKKEKEMSNWIKIFQYYNTHIQM